MSSARKITSESISVSSVKKLANDMGMPSSTLRREATEGLT